MPALPAPGASRLLGESGYKVMRWRGPLEHYWELGSAGSDIRHHWQDPGFSRRRKRESLLLWVARGGRLVIIDRRPDDYLLPRSREWKVTTEYLDFPMGIDAASAEQMTKDVKPVSPAQPTLLTRDVESVMPSRFLSAIKFFPVSKDGTKGTNSGTAADESVDEDQGFTDEDGDSPSKTGSGRAVVVDNSLPDVSPAPVVHLASSSGVLLIDYPHGKGRISLLSDPSSLPMSALA